MLSPHSRTLFAALAIVLIALTCGHEPPTVVTGDGTTPAGASPRVRLRLGGHLEGRLEPCGCASGQLGGLARRSFRILQDRSFDLLLEGGGVVRQSGPLAEQKLVTAMTVFAMREYAAIGVGPTDLALPAETFATFGFGIPAVAADLDVDPDGPLAAEWPVVPFTERDVMNETGTSTVRLTGLTTELPADAPDGIRLLEPADAWKRAMDGCAPGTLRIVLVHGSEARARKLTPQLDPKPDLVVAINGAHPEPPGTAGSVDGVPFVNPGTRGRYLLDVSLTRDGTTPRIVDYTIISLAGSRTAKGALEDRDVVSLLLEHRNTVKELGIREAEANRRPTANGQKYVGSARCATCHVEAHAAWSKSKHGTAWTTLEDAMSSGRYAWPVTHYPDCVSCHSVGYGETSGFVNPETTPDLRHVGCESCHGPGEKHVVNPYDNQFGPFRIETCSTCHDFEQSPGFDYTERWKTIEHGLESSWTRVKPKPKRDG